MREMNEREDILGSRVIQRKVGRPTQGPRLPSVANFDIIDIPQE